jgi:hypothetical protein
MTQCNSAVVDQFPESELLRQRGRQHQPRVGHRVLIIEGHHNAVKTARRSHQEDALLNRDDVGLVTLIIPIQRAFFADTRTPSSNASVDPG